jgi:hypothetical protein
MEAASSVRFAGQKVSMMTALLTVFFRRNRGSFIRASPLVRFSSGRITSSCSIHSGNMVSTHSGLGGSNNVVTSADEHIPVKRDWPEGHVLLHLLFHPERELHRIYSNITSHELTDSSIMTDLSCVPHSRQTDRICIQTKRFTSHTNRWNNDDSSNGSIRDTHDNKLNY